MLGAVAVVVAASLSPSSASAQTASTADVTALDEVVLGDGRRLVGRVIQEQRGRWLVLEAQDGSRRTIAWRLVEEVILAPHDERGKADLEAARSAWKRRGNGALTYELRAALTAVALPLRRFELAGSCATGTGVAPASMYGQAASDRGRALGGGIGGRVGYMYVPPLEPGGGASWWGMRAVVGLDLHALYAHVPVGLPAVRGELCSQVVRTRYTVATASSPILLMQIPVTLGVHLGLGKFEEPTRWRGVVLGLGWSPFLVHAVGSGGALDSHLNLTGVELTADFTTLHAGPGSGRPESHLRASVYFAPATDEKRVTMGTLAFGAAWY